MDKKVFKIEISCQFLPSQNFISFPLWKQFLCLVFCTKILKALLNHIIERKILYNFIKMMRWRKMESFNELRWGKSRPILDKF